MTWSSEALWLNLLLVRCMSWCSSQASIHLRRSTREKNGIMQAKALRCQQEQSSLLQNVLCWNGVSNAIIRCTMTYPRRCDYLYLPMTSASKGNDRHSITHQGFTGLDLFIHPFNKADWFPTMRRAARPIFSVLLCVMILQSLIVMAITIAHLLYRILAYAKSC